MPTQNVKWGIKLDGAEAIKQALIVLAQDDAPYLRLALEKSGVLFAGAAGHYTHPSIAAKIAFVGIKASGRNLRAVVRTRHPGASSREFGRHWYYANFRGRAQKATGQRVWKQTGQKAQPFLGIINGNAAIAETHDAIATLLTSAFAAEWERITNGS